MAAQTGAPMVIRVAANLDELKKNLAEGGLQIETTTQAMTRLASSFNGDRLIQAAMNTVAAVNQIGGATKLTAAEQERVNGLLDRALEKYRLLGREAPGGMQALADATKQTEPPTTLLTLGVGKLAGAFTLAAIAKWTADLFNAAGHLQDLTERTEVSVGALQRLSVIAEQSGSTIDAVSSAVFQMGKRLAGGDANAADAAKELGLNLEEVRRLKPEDAFNVLGKAIADIPDPMKQSELGAKLFGRSVQELLPVFKHLSDETGPYVTMSAQQVKLLDDLGDGWVRAKASIVPLTVSYIDQAFQISTLVAWYSNWFGELGQVPKLAGDAKTALDAYTKSVKDRAAVPLAMTEAEEARVERELADVRREQEAALKKFTEAMTELDSVGKGWQGTLDTIDGSVVQAIQYYLAAGVAQDKLATAYGLTAAQVKAVESQLKAYEEILKKVQAVEQEKDAFTLKGLGDTFEAQAKANKQAMDDTVASIDATNALWREHYGLRIRMGGTATDAAIADIDRWLNDEVAKLKADDVFYAQHVAALKALSEDKKQALALDWDFIGSHSQAYFDQAATKARATYDYMLQNSSQFSQETIAQYKAIADAAERTATHQVEVVKGATEAIKGVFSAFSASMGPSIESLNNAAMRPGSFLGWATGNMVQSTQSFLTNTSWALPGRASGGDVAAGQPYVVGERGPELFVPQGAGSIVPNGAGGIVINAPITIQGSVLSDESKIAKAVTGALMSSLRQAGVSLPGVA